MKRRIVRKLVGLYPAKWRKEYGAEFEDLLAVQSLNAAVVINVIANALRQQARIANHGSNTVGLFLLMTGVLRAICAAGTFWYALRAIGYRLIVQFAGLPSMARGDGVRDVPFGIPVFHLEPGLCLSSGTRERRPGNRCPDVVPYRAYGLPCIALVAVVSRSAVLRMPEFPALLVLFVGFVLGFVSRLPG